MIKTYFGVKIEYIAALRPLFSKKFNFRLKRNHLQNEWLNSTSFSYITKFSLYTLLPTLNIFDI